MPPSPRSATPPVLRGFSLIKWQSICRFGGPHLNLGGAHLKAQGESDTVGTWAIGYEFPLLENLQLTAETYGAEHVRPDTALGLRYEIFEGFKISGAVGHGNDRSFGKLGFAWEF